MCGIFGVVGELNNLSSYHTALGKLNHRGPDNIQSWTNDESVWFGHTRLAILDLDSRSNQPMVSKNTNCVLTYNGEIYNYKELKFEMENAGINFLTESDTEVVLKGLEVYGASFLSRLNGMFALAFYDPRVNIVTFARDRFGIKPLYISKNKKNIIFGSEIKSIKYANPDISVDLSSITEYLNFGCLLGSKTFYSGLSQIEPGQVVQLNSLNLEVKKSCNISEFVTHDRTSNGSHTEVLATINNLLERSVLRQMNSDVPVGLFLSGGVDSSAIAAFATKNSSSKLKTFTASFDFMKGKSELADAAYLSKYFNTEHYEFRIEGGSLPETLFELSYFFDEPFGDAANIPLFLMSREVKKYCKVVLQGDGGDEIFGGYPYHRRLKFHSLFYAAGLLNKVFGNAFNDGSRKTRTLEAVVESNEYKKLGRFFSSVMNRDDLASLLSKDINHIQSNRCVFERYREIGIDSSKNWLDRILHADRNIILPDLYLPKVDRSTMANSLETRVPFLDNELFNFVSGIEGNDLLYKGKTKGLLREALKGVVPDKILFAKKKGFGVPFGNWLKTSLYEYTKHELSSCSLFSSTPLKLLEEHKSGKKEHSFILWRLLQLAIWWRREG